MDEILDELVSACNELKAKTSRIDKMEHEIDGKSKTTMLTMGSEFHIGLIKGQSGVLVVVEDYARIPKDFFIKDLYAKLSKRMPSSPLQITFENQNLRDSKLDRNEDIVMLSEGAPEMAADIPDDASKKLPQAKVCRKCGTSNSSDNDYCVNCGRLLVSCPNCGHAPEDGTSFCTKCGHPLN